jgi:hypothetical protein
MKVSRLKRLWRQLGRVMFSRLIHALLSYMRFAMNSSAGVKPAKIIKPLRTLFSEILKNLSSDEQWNQPKIELAKLIENKLVEKIEQMREPSSRPAEPSTPSL